MHILCLVLFWSFSVFFLRFKGCPPPRPPFSVLTRKSLSCVHVQTYCNFFSVQAALLSAQPCLRNPRFLVSRLLYRVCNLCSCLLGHLHLAYNKVWRREGKLAVFWHGLHFLILKVVRQVVLGISLIYVPQAWSFCWGIFFVERVCLFFSPVYFLCQPSGIHCALRPRSLVFCYPL